MNSLWGGRGNYDRETYCQFLVDVSHFAGICLVLLVVLNLNCITSGLLYEV